jgi:adenylate cyclase
MAAEGEHACIGKPAGLPGYKFTILTGLLITIGLPLLILSMPTFLVYFNGKLYDEYLKRNAQVSASERILIVDIDESSLLQYGQWPWPRDIIAEIIDTLNKAGAAAIGLDMMFPERDRTSLSTIRLDLEDLLSITSSSFRPDNDLLLAGAISRSQAVLGYQFLFEEPAAVRDCLLRPLNLTGVTSASGSGYFPYSASHVTCNLTLLSKMSQHSGFFNVTPDNDGILRSVPLVIEYENHLYPCLALACVMKSLNLHQVGLIKDFDDYALTLGRTVAPLNSKGGMLVKYRGKGRTYRYVSAADLLADRVPAAYIKDKIVFVGTSAAGLKEFRATPTDPIFPGVEVHATVADNLLTADFISRPASAPGIEFITALLCGILYVFTACKSGALRSLLIVSGTAAALIFVSLLLFDAKGVYFSPVLPLLVLAANFALINLLNFWRQELHSRQQARDLARAQAAIIESMASLTETRDPETGGHIKRTQEYVRLLAEALRKHPSYKTLLTDTMINLLYKTAPLHDIGKVGISDRILLKHGKLTSREFEEIKKHVIIGKDVISAIQHRIGNQIFLRIAHEIAYTHHEKWDGTGYPQGLKGEQIPLAGRLMAIADVYDALTNKRVYKEALSHEEAVQVMTDLAETSFDPQIFSTFLNVCGDFAKIAHKLPDSPVNVSS